MNMHPPYKHPLQVTSCSDLFSLAGIWVSFIVLGQLAGTGYLASYFSHHFNASLLWIGCTLGVIYLAMDTTVYLIYRGRLIFDWLPPSLCLTAAVMFPACVIYFVKSIQTL